MFEMKKTSSSNESHDPANWKISYMEFNTTRMKCFFFLKKYLAWKPTDFQVYIKVSDTPKTWLKHCLGVH